MSILSWPHLQISAQSSAYLAYMTKGQLPPDNVAMSFSDALIISECQCCHGDGAGGMVSAHVVMVMVMVMVQEAWRVPMLSW